MENLSGKQFKEYQIDSAIAEGGMAAVYKAHQSHLERYVAIKVLPRQYALEHQFVERFRREAKVLAKLQHPHILPIYDYGIEGEYFYLVMPYIDGGTLEQLMAQRRLPLSAIARVFAQVGDALDYAHAQEVVHRDLKPSNILVDKRGNCLLSDFGLAKVDDERASKLTSSGLILGTADYMSPEQGLGQVVDHRSDIYSLGVILYELTTGQTPFHASTPTAVIIKTIQEPMVPPRQLNPDLPVGVEAVILKACAKKPEERFATVHEMVESLQTAINSAGVQEKPISDWGLQSGEGEDEITLSRLRKRLRPQSDPVVLPPVVEKGEPRPPTYSLPSPPPAVSRSQTETLLTWGIAVLALLVVVMVAVTIVWVINQSQDNNTVQPGVTPGGSVPTPPGGGPPAEAFAVCEDLNPGDACVFVSPQGHTISGSCGQMPSGFACNPSEPLPAPP